MLTAAGGVLGIILAQFAMNALLDYVPTTLPRVELTAMNGAALLYAAGLSLCIGFLIGLLPIRQFSAAIGDELRWMTWGTSAGRGIRGVRAALIVAEVALSFALLIGAGLLTRSLARLNHVDTGFDSHHLLAIGVSLPRPRYDERSRTRSFLDRVDAELDSERRVESYSVISMPPVSGTVSRVPFSRKDRPVTPDLRQFANYRFAGPHYFHTMRVPLRAGRDFSLADDERVRAVAVVSEQFARRYLQDVPPLGSHLLINDSDGGPRDVEIVGVAGNVKQFGLDSEPDADIYVPLRQVPDEPNGFLARGFTLVLRSDSDPRALTAPIKNLLLRAEPDAALTPAAMEDVLIRSLAVRQFQTAMMSSFAGFATLLAAFGMYGVMSYLTAQRAREIGLRMALGTTAPGVAGLVVKQGLTYTAAGIGAGAALIMASYRFIESKLYMTPMLDAMTFASAITMLLLVSALASWIPAMRAARIDPVVILRGE